MENSKLIENLATATSGTINALVLALHLHEVVENFDAIDGSLADRPDWTALEARCLLTRKRYWGTRAFTAIELVSMAPKESYMKSDLKWEVSEVIDMIDVNVVPEKDGLLSDLRGALRMVEAI